MCSKEANIQERGAKWIDRFNILCEPTDKNSLTEVQSRRHNQVRRKPHFHLRQYLQRLIGKESRTQHTDDIYKCALRPLLPLLIKQGIVTCFAYGQTGSGKTFTMNGLQEQLVSEVFEIAKKMTINVTYFEIYGGRCLDLLNDKTVLNIMEDKNGNIQIPGLTEKTTESAKDLLGIMEQANANRTTHATVANDTSSRSYAICQIYIRKGEDVVGKLVLVDLAGS